MHAEVRGMKCCDICNFQVIQKTVGAGRVEREHAQGGRTITGKSEGHVSVQMVMIFQFWKVSK